MNDLAAMQGALRRIKPSLRQIEDKCLNGEAEVARLSSPLTAIDDLFVRNNGDWPCWPPDRADEWLLRIDGEVAEPTTLSLGDLKAGFQVHEQVAVIECAGNGRAFLEPPAEGLPWRHGAVGCARWTGFRLADILRAPGVLPSAVYAAFESPDRQVGFPDRPAFSRGLPIGKAMAEETMLAFAVNGEPLPPLHGGPLRIVAPGFPGAAWQKWVTRIWLRDREHDGVKMTRGDYRINGEVIVDMPVKSLITMPLEGFTCARGEMIEVAGFAWSGHVPLASVEISADGGDSWAPAELAAAGDRFAWRPFRACIAAPDAEGIALVARASNAEGAAQPLGNAAWNAKGYCNNVVHRVSGRALPRA